MINDDGGSERINKAERGEKTLQFVRYKVIIKIEKKNKQCISRKRGKKDH